MELPLRAHLRSGDQPGVQGNNLISGDVPDQIKRAGAKGKPKPSDAAINPDFTEDIGVIIPNPNPVDTGMDSLSAQADIQLTINIEEKIEEEKIVKALTFMDLTSGVHKAEDIWSLITLVRTSGIPDAKGHWKPYKDTCFPWSDALVAELLQLGKDMLACEANLVVDGIPRRYIEPETLKVNSLEVAATAGIQSSSSAAGAFHPGLANTTTNTVLPNGQSQSSSVTTILPLSQDALTRHEVQHPSTAANNLRPPSPEGERREKETRLKERKEEKKHWRTRFDDGVDRTPPAVRQYVGNYPSLLPSIQEPNENFEVPVGDIPPPMSRGSVSRRMRSIMGEDNPKIKRWDEVDYCERSVDLHQKEFASDIFEILYELDGAHLQIEVILDLNTDRALYKWIQAMSLKSSMIQTLFCC